MKSMELSRLFFAGLAKPEEQPCAIRDYIRQMEDAKSALSSRVVRGQKIFFSLIGKAVCVLDIVDIVRNGLVMRPIRPSSASEVR